MLQKTAGGAGSEDDDTSSSRCGGWGWKEGEAGKEDDRGEKGGGQFAAFRQHADKPLQLGRGAAEAK